MIIGVIVEGAGEIDAIEQILIKIKSDFDIRKTPLRADLQPKANPRVIARSARSQVMLWKKRGVDCIVILIDREDHDCPVEFAKDLRIAFDDMYSGMEVEFRIVIKDKKIENWLVADTEALKKIPGRFEVSQKFERTVLGRADGIGDAAALINTATGKKRYHKGEDPALICRHQDPLRASKNSRSYRKFLRELGCSDYLLQSKLPYDSPKASPQQKQSVPARRITTFEPR
ncbi:DUF4276 family protein [Burkholderia gladioli]|uniref:DUF4276 family protein n=1 Tax=Burkholderia gladioli TaxID=28095 RepID=UPI0016405153|nr:DUF4276 family protein [Burkholderia gladioli]